VKRFDELYASVLGDKMPVLRRYAYDDLAPILNRSQWAEDEVAMLDSLTRLTRDIDRVELPLVEERPKSVYHQKIEQILWALRFSLTDQEIEEWIGASKKGEAALRSRLAQSMLKLSKDHIERLVALFAAGTASTLALDSTRARYSTERNRAIYAALQINDPRFSWLSFEDYVDIYLVPRDPVEVVHSLFNPFFVFLHTNSRPSKNVAIALFFFASAGVSAFVSVDWAPLVAFAIIFSTIAHLGFFRGKSATPRIGWFVQDRLFMFGLSIFIGVLGTVLAPFVPAYVTMGTFHALYNLFARDNGLPLGMSVPGPKPIHRKESESPTKSENRIGPSGYLGSPNEPLALAAVSPFCRYRWPKLARTPTRRVSYRPTESSTTPL
jgi:hypothetical protein